MSETTPTVEQATRDAIEQVGTVRNQLLALASAAITAADTLDLLTAAQENQL